ncbi:MAG: cation:proton antiporter [Holosporales bacterium]|jgi:CPA2 family monovalent cation:H+ antiporter-2|nr:cation:proton antiporter [Holosporales bacterium]
MNNEYVFAHLTVVILVAAISGVLLARLNQPIMIGYILAGVMFGPSGFSFISSQDQIHFYSELGILLLLFVIGMELNIKSFLKMWKIPTLFTLIQVGTNTILALLFSFVFNWPIYVSLLVAFIISLSSTAAIVKVLEHIGELRTDVGHISIGILVAQDIVIVPMMLIMRECKNALSISIIFDVIVAIGLVVLLIKYLGRREKIIVPSLRFLSNAELTPVVTLGLCFAAASIVVLFGLSEAYGAFLAGLFIGNTQERQNVINSVKPIQNVLLMAFFLSIGLMFDVKFLIDNWYVVLLTLLGVTIWKIVSNSLLLRVFSIEMAKSVSIGIILAQLGEFSLLLANVAVQSQTIDGFGQKLIVCVTALSLSISSIFISLSTKTKNLSFLGDNSITSILKVLFSKRFSDEVKKLTVKHIAIKSGK